MEVMGEFGIDISTGHPKKVDEFKGLDFGYVITVCEAAREACPVFICEVTQNLHMGFADPAEATGTDEEILTVFRGISEEIRVRFTKFYDNHLGLKGVADD